VQAVKQAAPKLSRARACAEAAWGRLAVAPQGVASATPRPRPPEQRRGRPGRIRAWRQFG
jgi:hypothetical protein